MISKKSGDKEIQLKCGKCVENNVVAVGSTPMRRTCNYRIGGSETLGGRMNTRHFLDLYRLENALSQ